MSKYIIELERGETAYKTVDSCGTPLIQLLNPTPYTDLDTEKVREEAFKNGYDAACKDIDVKSKTNAAYRKGLDEAWEAARKIAKLNTDEQKRLFGCFGIYFVAHEFSAHEAIEKIGQYEQEKKEQIQVGDEVEAVAGKAVIIQVFGNGDVRYMYPDASIGFNDSCSITRTGRHFPEIAEVLRKMQEEKE